MRRDKQAEEVVANEIDKLIEEYGENESDLFEAMLPNGTAWKFRTVTDYSEILAMAQKAREFVALCFGDKKRIPPAMKPYLPSSAEAAKDIWLVHYLLEEPKYDQADVMKFAKKLGLWFAAISAQVQTRQKYEEGVAVKTELDQAGEDSAQTQ